MLESMNNGSARPFVLRAFRKTKLAWGRAFWRRGRGILVYPRTGPPKVIIGSIWRIMLIGLILISLLALAFYDWD